MGKTLSIIGIAALFAFNLACPRGLDGEPAETAAAAETGDLTETREAPPGLAAGRNDRGELAGPTSDEGRNCIYSSTVDPPAIGSDLPTEVTDDIFLNKTISLYYTESRDEAFTDLIIELSEPDSSPYVGKIRLSNITLYKHYSAGEELFYEGPVGPGVERVVHGAHLLTYSIEFEEPYFATAAQLVLDMTYDLEDYGTGEMRADIWIEP